MDSNLSSSSFVTETTRILAAIDDTERGTSHEWKNVQPVVVQSTRRLHQCTQSMLKRLDDLEEKMDRILVAVTTLTHDRQVKEERYASDNRAFTRAWSKLEEDVDYLRQQHDRVSAAHHEALRLLRETTIPELERELDAVREVHRVQTRKENRIDQLEQDNHELRTQKVDQRDFHNEILTIRQQLDQMNLFPAFHAGGGGKGSISSSSDMLLSGGNGAALSVSRWVWNGGSFREAAYRTGIPWTSRVLRVGDATKWNSQHPQVIKVEREGVYRVHLALFHDGRSVGVPALTLYLNNDPLLNALSTAGSNVLLRSAAHQPASSHNILSADKKSSVVRQCCKRCRAVRCCCDPAPCIGVTLSDSIFAPAGSIITVIYDADPRNVLQAVLELECLS